MTSPPQAYSAENLPRRPRTQSPELSKGRPGARKPSHDSRVGNGSSYQPTVSFAAATAAAPTEQFHTTAPHSADDNLNFMQPSDPYLASDPLQRWKGAPVFCWNPVGLTSTHFPKHVPMFGGGNSAPSIKSSPGQIKLERTRTRVPVDDTLVAFPGPLKSKGKKKELLSWLSTRVEAQQREASSMQSMDPRPSERLMLWQLLKVFIEHDGNVSGNPSADLAVRSIVGNKVARSRSNSTQEPASAVAPDATNPEALAEVKHHLMSGDRDKAAWHAADNRLWGHALLISSTAPDGNLWKQVAQEFVRSEVRTSKGDTKSLAALYEIFAHNWEESVDELVPASARAGFQMMPTAERNGHAQNALEGLNKWQETLCMVLGTRSAEDERGLLALGRLLRSYGRIEAAHICFLFAKGFARPGGIDDPEADFTLLGADASEDSLQDVDSILLSEVFEFGLLLNSAASSVQHLPHLQAYKLHHAHVLADSGYRDTAMSYCESIGNAIKSMTRPSPYYHPALVVELEDLTKRLSEAPKDGSSSWMSKPTLGKMSGSMWARFNTFVTGDDDAASNGSGGHSEETGPFGRVAGTPSISRNASVADLSSFTPMGLSGASGASGASVAPPQAHAPPTNSRYAPNYMPQPQQPQVQPHQLHQSPPQSAGSMAHPNPYAPTAVPQEIAKPSSSHSYNPYHPAATLGISDNVSQVSSSYDPPILQPPSSQRLGFDVGSPSFTHASSRVSSSHGPPSIPSQDQEMSVIDEEEPSKMNGYMSNGYEPPPATGAITELDQTEASGGYAPPSMGGGYAPPSAGYQPYEPVQATEEEDEPPKRRGMMDDDDDGFAPRSSSMKNANRAENDRAADDAFRAAAEADAKRDREAKEARRSSGWLSGWFKKDPNAPTVHKAKLGEESSFYFDPETKKWVNKKGGDAAPASSGPAPPPPRAGPPMGISKPPSASSSPGLGALPPRTSSAGMPPGAALPQSSAPGTSASSLMPTPGSASRVGTPAGDGGPPGTGIPSRPPTSMSNASSIDDLIGAPAARKPGGGKKGKKGGRYVDVMAK